MMGRQTVDQSQLFYLFNLEEQIPADHLLRRLNGHRRHFAERNLMESAEIAGSLRLDAGELDHLGPFLGFVG